MHFSCRNRSSNRSFLLLAPLSARVECFKGEIIHSEQSYDHFLEEMQRLRGRIYLQDGAVKASDLGPDGRHISPFDTESWHLLTVSSSNRVLGCARFQQHSNSVFYNQLGVRHSSIARSNEWGSKMRSSIHAELESARLAGFSYVEVGGWALSEELWGSTEALHGALAIFAWSRLLGGALGIATATERNNSASILRRLGGRSLQWEGESLPSYYDRRYSCFMEVLRFDSRSPNPKYSETIELLLSRLAEFPVIRRRRSGIWGDSGCMAETQPFARWAEPLLA